MRRDPGANHAAVGLPMYVEDEEGDVGKPPGREVRQRAGCGSHLSTSSESSRSVRDSIRMHCPTKKKTKTKTRGRKEEGGRYRPRALETSADRYREVDDGGLVEDDEGLASTYVFLVLVF